MAEINETLAALLREYSGLFAMNGGDPIRVRSYQKAADSIVEYPQDVSTVPVRDIPNVGEAIALKLEEALTRGTFRQLEDLRGKIPAGARSLLAIDSLGPKKAMQLYTDLGVDSPAALRAAIEQGRLKGLKGYGPQTEKRILQSIEELLR